MIGDVVPRLSEEDQFITGVSAAEVSRTCVVQSVLAGTGVFLISDLVDRLFVSLGMLGVGALVLVSSVTCFVRPLRRVTRRARELRAEFDLSVAVLLDLVNIQTAGGAGIETALVSSAAVGDGWCFDQMRDALSRAQASRTTYWDGLGELGRRAGVSSLVEIAHSARLSGEHGARIRRSLVTKASSLRARNLARMEHDAHQRTEQMGLPMVVLFISFLVFIGYPAMAQTMGSL